MENDATMRVLVVDDDAVHRRFARSALAGQGADVEVDEAPTGGEGLRLAQAHAYDAILLDYQLPDTDGVAVLDALRANRVASPVVVLTGKGSEDVAVRFMKGGATDYLTKEDLTPTRLVQTLQSVVRAHRMTDEVARLETALLERERAALVGALCTTTLRGFREGVAGLEALLAPVWARLPTGGPDARALAEARAEVEATLRALLELEDVLDLLRRLLAPGAARGRTGLDDAVGQTLGVYRRVAPPGIVLEESLATGAEVLAEPAALRQMLVHLLNNAIEAMPEGGRVLVQTRAEGGQLVLSVLDEGPGVPRALGARAFGLHVTTKPEHEGLGLTITRHIAALHGGTLECANPGEKGACFIIRLPRAP